MIVIRALITSSSVSSLCPESVAASPKSMVTTISSQWVSLLTMLVVFLGVTSAIPADAGAAGTLRMEPEVVNMTNVTLTVVAGADWCVDCTVSWQYKRAGEGLWRDAGTESVKKQKTIYGLQPDTSYVVRGNITYDEQFHGSYVKEAASVDGSTCSGYPEKPWNIWTDEKGIDFLTVGWMPTYPDHHRENKCGLFRYFISWEAHETEEHSSESDSAILAPCPKNATLLSNMTMYKCGSYSYSIQYCYTVHDLKPATRYLIQVTALDAMGICSAPGNLHTATNLKIWGNIGIGSWIFIILSVLLLITAVSALLVFLRRRAARKASVAGVAFTRDNDGED